MGGKRKFIIGSLVIVGAGVAYLAVTGRIGEKARTEAPAQTSAPALPVIITAAKREDLAVELKALGSVEALESVAIKARIDGAIDRVLFKDGDDVKPGDLLFALDARAIEAQLRQAESALVRDRASLANAKRELERQTQLAQRDYATRSAVDKATTDAQVLEAIVRSDEAAIEGLRVQLTYTQIRAPIEGRTGNIALTKGNLVKANDTTALVTINRIQPIKVAFSLPQRDFARLAAAQQAGPVAVTARLAGSPPVIETGTVEFIDNQLDATTGTIRLKGVFSNADRALWPGMFIDVSLRLGTESNVLTVPTSAVQQGQQGSYVYVVGGDSVARVRLVKVVRVADGRTILEFGLEVGEDVVLDGQLRLADGMRVEKRNRTADAKP